MKHVSTITEQWLIDYVSDYSTVYERMDKETGAIYSYNVECSLDIETSSVKIQEEKSAFMYIWMFQIGDEKATIYGRYWEELLNLLKKIASIMKLSLNRKLICYIHNESFEFQFMMKYFNWINVFAIDERKPIKALCSLGIEFKDSYILSGMNLNKTGENLINHKIRKQVGFLDYDKVRTPDTTLTEKELLYCEDDVKVVCSYINEQIEQYGDITKIPLTNTGRVRNLVRNACFYDNKSHKKSSTGKYKRYSALMKKLTINGKEYKMLQRAFAGGYTHANANHVGKLLHNIGSFDFTSSYPTVMLSEQYPMSKAVDLKPKSITELENYSKTMCIVFDVEFDNLLSTFEHENYISESKCFVAKNTVVNNGRIVKAEQIRMTITNVDYDIIKHTYQWEHMKIGKVIGYYKGYLPKPILTSIIDLYQKKTMLKNVAGKEVEYLNSKGMLNSVYGMSVTDVVQDTNTYDNIKGWYQDNTDFNKQIEKYNKSKKRFLFYPWGIFVTAYARRNLWTGILSVKNDYIYSDTDSLKCANIENHMDYINSYNEIVKNKLKKMCVHYDLDFKLLAPKTIQGKVKQIGVWDNEGVYKLFKTLGAKRYMFYKDGKLALTVAGLSKKNGIKYMERITDSITDVFNMFNDDLYIPAVETGKMTHTYIDTEMQYTIADYQGHKTFIKTLSGVHLEPCDFTLSLSVQFKDFIQHLLKGEIYKGVSKFL